MQQSLARLSGALREQVLLGRFGVLGIAAALCLDEFLVACLIQ